MFCVQELLLWELHPGFGHSDIAGDLSMEIFQWVLTQWGSLPLLDVHEERSKRAPAHEVRVFCAECAEVV